MIFSAVIAAIVIIYLARRGDDKVTILKKVSVGIVLAIVLMIFWVLILSCSRH